MLAVLGPCACRPMVSSSSGGGASNGHSAGGGGGGADNPFAATYFYAYEGVIFEVMKNHHLASITLFRPQQ